MNAATGSVEHYLDQFSGAEPQLPGRGLPWLKRLRREAMERFSETGFPGPRTESWKYTRTAPIEKRAFRPTFKPCRGLLPEDIEGCFFDALPCHRLVFVNGLYTPQLSAPGELPRGATLGSLARGLAETPEELEPHLGAHADAGAHAFAALNAAFMTDGAWLRLAPGVVLERPVHLVHLATPQEQEFFAHPRHLVVAGENSEATVIESHVSLGDARYLNNVVTEAVLAAGARLTHVKLQRESRKGFHVATLQAQQERDSRFASHSFSFGAALARNDINAALDAEGCECTLNGLYMAAGRQHVDYHTLIDHRKPNCTSRERYKGVLDGHGRGVFNGRVYVHPDAQHTDSEQSNANLLLSPDAEADTKPQLEIWADDVKCTHGATVGQLDERMVFYLRSRGIDEQTARGLLVYGFAREVVDQVPLAPVRDRLGELMLARLPDAAFVRGLVA